MRSTCNIFICSGMFELGLIWLHPLALITNQGIVLFLMVWPYCSYIIKLAIHQE